MAMNSGSTQKTALLAVGIALLSALFFTMTYVLNRISANMAGHWMWTASLRYLITLPILFAIMPWLGGWRTATRAITRHPGAWLLYSGIGFVLFYIPLAYAADSGPSWLIAGTFQFTVIAGMLCAPFIYKDERRRIPKAAFAIGVLILAGVSLMQLGQSGGMQLDRKGWIAFICVLVSATAYPLGNRLLLLHLEKTGEQLNATQRVFGLTLASQPYWIALAIVAFNVTAPPTWHHVGLAAGVAISAGIVATILFFKATGLVKDNPSALGAAEAMQAAELLFATLIGVMFLQERWPQGAALLGCAFITVGIILFARLVSRQTN